MLRYIAKATTSFCSIDDFREKAFHCPTFNEAVAWAARTDMNAQGTVVTEVWVPEEGGYWREVERHQVFGADPQKAQLIS